MATRAKLLPSETSWVQEVADRLLGGDRLVARGLPRSGKTLLSGAVATLLGDSGFYFDGSAVTEQNQVAEHKKLRNGIEARLTAHGCAQLIFDNYGSAVRRSRGGILHSQLYGQLVDGPHSRDIGALFTSRYADALDRKVSGSPLIGRASFIELPRLTEQDAAIIGLEFEVARSQFGESTWLAHALLNSVPMGALENIVGFVSINSPSLARDLPVGAIQVLTGGKNFREVDLTSRRALYSFGRQTGNSYNVADLVAESRLIADLRGRNLRWPSNEQASVARFCELLADGIDVLWVDRYLYERPERLAQFLASVRQFAVVPVRLLGKPTTDHQDVRGQIAAALRNAVDVEARVMAYQDVQALHDRHLVDPASSLGFVIPMADVILGEIDAGSAVAVEMPSIQFDYEACWHRATPMR